jgi:hypothetical protein
MWTFSLVLLCTSLVPSQELQESKRPLRDEAEELFNSMEAKLSSARSIRIKAILEMKGEIVGKTSSLLCINRESNKFYYEAMGQIGDSPISRKVVSNGTEMKSQGFEGSTWSQDPKGSLSGENYILAFTRLGLSRGFELAGSVRGGLDVRKRTKVSAFKVLKKDYLGNRSVTEIEFVVSFDEKNTSSRKCSLWVDPATFMPVKATWNMSAELDWSLSETYEEIAVNPELESKMFEVPPK